MMVNPLLFDNVEAFVDFLLETKEHLTDAELEDLIGRWINAQTTCNRTVNILQAERFRREANRG